MWIIKNYEMTGYGKKAFTIYFWHHPGTRLKEGRKIMSSLREAS
jgi:hypothetical protein